MLNRTVEIAGDNRFLCKERGFLAVYHKGERLGRLPLDDLGVVLAAGHGLTYSNNLLVALAERCVPLVICDQRMRPSSICWPVKGHFEQSGRMTAQVAANQPTKKRLWRQLVQAKISFQALAAESRGIHAGHLAKLAAGVKSGDSGNVEAVAARQYWRVCFGPDFRRHRKGDGLNPLLNYGYTILRSATARAVMLSGLHPAFGLHHHNKRNTMPLVDDLMEPFRPVVDLLVLSLADDGERELSTAVKGELAAIPNVDLRRKGKISPVSSCLQALASSLADIFLGERKKLLLPESLVLPVRAATQ